MLSDWGMGRCVGTSLSESIKRGLQFVIAQVAIYKVNLEFLEIR